MRATVTYIEGLVSDLNDALPISAYRLTASFAYESTCYIYLTPEERAGGGFLQFQDSQRNVAFWLQGALWTTREMERREKHQSLYGESVGNRF